MAIVYLLGAGFSRAISTEMPTMRDLSTDIKTELRDKNIPGWDTPISLDFEQWLSYLIERPPWLSTDEQENNSAGFFAVSTALRRILSERQGRAVDLQDECPVWLRRLVAYWQATCATVITFNYDNLLELAWRMYGAAGTLISNDSREAQFWTDLYPFPIPLVTRRFTMPPGRGLPQTTGMKLIKLHGSLTWRYARANAGSGGLIYETAGLGNCWWNAQSLSSSWPAEYWADLEPMIVPPTAVKSPYYSNGVLQAYWKLAANALSEAEELVIMGFSLPHTDLLVSSMLASTLWRDSKITPVNPSTKILDRLTDTFDLKGWQGARINSSFVGLGADALPRWVEDHTS